MSETKLSDSLGQFPASASYTAAQGPFLKSPQSSVFPTSPQSQGTVSFLLFVWREQSVYMNRQVCCVGTVETYRTRILPKLVQAQILEGHGFSLKNSGRRGAGAGLLANETMTLGSSKACVFWFLLRGVCSDPSCWFCSKLCLVLRESDLKGGNVILYY